ncbi:MAG: hypothetical protein NZ925_04660, partial [Sulfolobales archaeon]|nr:hypothetical protein [Sulfolobales archaeon]
MSKHVKTVASYLILTLVLVSTLTVAPLVLPVAEAQAPSITIPDKRFNPEKAIMVEVRGEFGPYIVVRITDDRTGALLAEDEVPKVAPAYYVFYLGGPDSYVEYPVG